MSLRYGLEAFIDLFKASSQGLRALDHRFALMPQFFFDANGALAKAYLITYIGVEPIRLPDNDLFHQPFY